MKTMLKRLGLGLLVFITLIGGLFGYFVYTPDPTEPALTGTFSKASIDVNGEQYTYRMYLPKQLPQGAPLLLVLHGSGQNGAQIRLETGYGFDRLADAKQFGVVYPSSKSFDWHDCSKTGDFQVDGRDLDHVAYLNQLVDTLVATQQFDRNRVFVTGVSSGGFMSLRLALQSPNRFRAVAAVSANLPSAANSTCTAQGTTSSVLLMNGTADPLVPYHGGRAALWGMFFDSGEVLSAQASAEFFAAQNQLTAQPLSASDGNLTDAALGNTTVNDDRQVADLEPKILVERRVWQGVRRNQQDASRIEVELITIANGGHGMPQPYWQRPRLLGPSPMSPNGPELIWQFFAQQQP